VALTLTELRGAAAPSSSPELRAGVERLARGDSIGALAVLEPLCKREPELAIGRAYLGVAYLRLTRVADAREELEEAVRLAPESFICRSKYAEFLARLGFYDQAVAQLDAALGSTAPDSESRLAAIELRDYSRGKSNGLYYRPLAYPKLSRLIPRPSFGRKPLSIQGEN
jgi:tetratricopeptide (TPR) repeat protein